MINLDGKQSGQANDGAGIVKRTKKCNSSRHSLLRNAIGSAATGQIGTSRLLSKEFENVNKLFMFA